MFKAFTRSKKRAKTMAQILKLKDASAPWRELIDAFSDKPQEGIVQDENDQVVAAVLPAQQYEA
jgi:hypothetical protein